MNELSQFFFDRIRETEKKRNQAVDKLNSLVEELTYLRHLYSLVQPSLPIEFERELIPG